MAKAVLLHRADSRYDDSWEAYHFPKSYLSRMEQTVGDWVLFMEPVKAGPRGYYAVAKIGAIRDDPADPDHFYADIDTSTYLEFGEGVAFQSNKIYPERSVLNEAGNISGRAQSAVRVIPSADFNRIIDLAVQDDEELPRDDKLAESVAEEVAAYQFDQDREKVLTSRTKRDAAFRRRILTGYNKRCAFTGSQWINGGGRAEVQAAHIKPVEADGPDSIRNGLALSGTVHWMFDRGLLGLQDDGRILVSNQINDIERVQSLLTPDRQALLPELERDRPHPAFLAWHRCERFKGIAV